MVNSFSIFIALSNIRRVDINGMVQRADFLYPGMEYIRRAIFIMITLILESKMLIDWP